VARLAYAYLALHCSAVRGEGSLHLCCSAVWWSDRGAQCSSCEWGFPLMRFLATAAASFDKQAAKELNALLTTQLGTSDVVDTKTGRLLFSLPGQQVDSVLPLLCSLQCAEHLFASCLEASADQFFSDGQFCPQLLSAAAQGVAPAVYGAATRARATVQAAGSATPQMTATVPTFRVSVRAAKKASMDFKRAVAAAVADGTEHPGCS
jgi:hypothetical protein